MATMPRGEPRSVPDPEGEAYDEWVRRKRAQEAREMAAERALDAAPTQRWSGSPARMEADDAMAATPMDPNAFWDAPVVGPALEGIEDVRGRRPVQAVGNATLAVVDAALLATGVGVLNAIERGVANNVGVRTAEAVRKQLRRRGVTLPGQEINHTFELNGIKRTVENWRNHPAFLKVMEKADHRRLRGKWGDLPRYDPIRRAWIGSPDWMKAVPAWIAARGYDTLTKPQINEATSKPLPRSPYGERPLR